MKYFAGSEWRGVVELCTLRGLPDYILTYRKIVISFSTHIFYKFWIMSEEQGILHV